MSRAPFNTTMDLVFGARSPHGIPGVVNHAALPCRVVEQTKISFLQQGYTSVVAWITAEGPLGNLSHGDYPAVGLLHIDFYTGDEIAVPSGVAPNWGVILGQEVNDPPDPPYYRYLVAAIPPWPI